MTTAELFKDIHEIEGRLCPGSETPLLGHFVERMDELAEHGGDFGRASESEVKLDAEEVKWWATAYCLYERDQSLPASDQATDIQYIFDQV